jgi:MoaA/NifB/PqqE/SkfB family radical SAM enzyme
MNNINIYEYPMYVTFCITSICNANCIHCSSGTSSKGLLDLSTSQILKVLDELHDCGVFSIALSGGEPLLHPDFLLIAKSAVDKGFSVGAGTNGKVITPKMIDIIKKSGLNHIQVSLDGCKKETHDSFRGVEGMFDSAVEGIRNLIKSGIKTNVCMTPTKLNYKEFSEVIDLCYNLGVNGFNLSQFVPTGRGTEEMDLSNEQWKNIMEIWYEKKNTYRDKMKFTSHEAQMILVDKDLYDMKGFIGCQAGQANCCIQSDGTVTPCVMLNVPLGNVKENSFADIWNHSEVIKKLKPRNKISGYCGYCENLYKCGGCRGVAFGKTGDFLASDSRCWRENKEILSMVNN